MMVELVEKSLCYCLSKKEMRRKKSRQDDIGRKDTNITYMKAMKKIHKNFIELKKYSSTLFDSFFIS